MMACLNNFASQRPFPDSVVPIMLVSNCSIRVDSKTQDGNKRDFQKELAGRAQALCFLCSGPVFLLPFDGHFVHLPTVGLRRGEAHPLFRLNNG
jgi:hypothetical protein